MQWELDWGDKVVDLLRFEEDSGIRPKALENKPELMAHLEYPLAVFWVMSDVRPPSVSGVSRLTIHDFKGYCWLSGTPQGQEAQDLWGYIRVLDRAFVQHLSEKNAKKPA